MEETSLHRTLYLDRLATWHDTPLIKVLVGMRRVGKSTLLRQWQHMLPERLGANPKAIFLLELDTLAHSDIKDWKQLRNAVQAFLEKAPRKARKYLLIDEVQLVPGWEKVINALHKQGNMDIYVTGSNAQTLSSELATLLSGRYVEIPIRPFGYAETLAIRDTRHSDAEFQRFLRYGGLPVQHHMADEPIVLQQVFESVFNTVVMKDVVARHAIRNFDLLDRVVRYFFDNIGNLSTAKNIADYLKSQRVAASVDAIQNYLHYLEQAFLLYRVRRLDLKGKRILEINEKFYAGEFGIRNAVLRRGTEDIAQLLENVVFDELLRRGYQVYVGKFGDREIDFVAERGNQREYFQVCYLLATEETSRREFYPLERLQDNWPKTILSLDPVDHSQKGIAHRHIARWLLEQ